VKLRPPIVLRFHSNAEARVFKMLESSTTDGVALHSLNLPVHQYKQWAEVDFVVVSPGGVFLLEVKGGRIECRSGIWYFTDRFGQEHRRSESPFDQVRSAMFALRKVLDDRGLSGLSRQFVWGWGVVFPDANCPQTGVEIPESTILDRHALERTKNQIDPYLSGLARYWRTRSPNPPVASDRELDDLINALRPDFEVVPTVAQQVDEIVEQTVRLTDEQLRVLDSCEENPRILCHGPAGTGKTVLAAELARRDAAAGRRVALICRRPELASFVARGLPKRGVVVLSGPDIATPSSQLFDRIIVDEAQDFLTPGGWTALDKLVRGGLERGEWRLFMDSNNQAGLETEVDPSVLGRLRSIAMSLRLTRNCRNTRQIVVQTTLFTGASLGEAQVDGRGLKVEVVITSGAQQVSEKLANRIREWLRQDVRPGFITILSPRPWAESAARFLPADLADAVSVLDGNLAREWPSPRITFSTVRQFKGFENRCVAVVDLDDFDGQPKAIAELYVAMTRANAALWLAIPISRKGLLDSLSAKNALSLVSERG